MFTPNELQVATAGRWEGPAAPPQPGPLAIDSRQVPRGGWYLCVEGQRLDGHAFASAALGQGAGGVIAREGKPLELPGPAPVLRVADPRAALGAIARFHRRRWGRPLVALTGSSGKTTTKELVAAALALEGPCHATLANHNNEVGVPLTLLGLGPEHLGAVVEMGMRGLGQIEELATWAEAQVGLITNVGVAHLELLGSPQAIDQAKTELWRALPPGGWALAPTAPGQGARLAPFLAMHPGPVLHYGLAEEPEAEVAAEPPEAAGEGRMRVVVWDRRAGTPARCVVVEAPGWGEHQRRNVAAAVAARVALGRPWVGALELWPRALTGRQGSQVVGGVRLVDDTYNANPASLWAAAQAFWEEPGPWTRRFLVHGAMGELGPEGPALHAQLSAQLEALPWAGRWAVGPGAEAYGPSGPSMRLCPGLDQAAQELLAQLRPGDAVLFKASRFVGLEALVAKVAEGLTGQEAPC